MVPNPKNFKPWLYLPPFMSHSLGPHILRAWGGLKKAPSLHLKNPNPLKALRLKFYSPFGTAGGLDKTASDLNTWTRFSAGFLEVGTFTPKPQGPNPGKILDRSNQHQSLWNCMGFPNAGFKKALPKLESFKAHHTHTPLFVNIGKNRATPLPEAHKDYIEGLHFFNSVADVFVINISSPNTKDLRSFHQKEKFSSFMDPIANEAIKQKRSVPILLKLSPDLSQSELQEFLSLSCDFPIAGYTLTNTTSLRIPQSPFPKRGGVSGAPLTQSSRTCLKVAKKTLLSLGKKDRTLISVGGVLSPKEALHRLELGADLVQFYSGLLFYGPHLFRDSFELWSS